MPFDQVLPVSDSTRAGPLAPDAMSMRSLAMWCVSRGWPVHPLTAGRKTPAANCAHCTNSGHTYEQCPCLPAGRWCHGFRAATLDRARVHNWWERNPKFGVGVSCGPARLVVIDIDAHHAPLPDRDSILPGIPINAGVDLRGLANGFHTLGVLAALCGAASPADDESTLRVKTPSGGMHVWYRAEAGRQWQCSSGSGARRALAWQVDVRAHGGYIIAPGTRTTDGRYEPVGGARTPAPLPRWLAQQLERTHHLPAPHVPAARPVPPRARQAVIAAGGGRAQAHRALDTVLTEVTACTGQPENAGFSEKLNRAAYTAGGLVAAGVLPRSEAESALTVAALTARPGQERRCLSIIRSGLTAGMRHPLHPGGSR